MQNTFKPQAVLRDLNQNLLLRYQYNSANGVGALNTVALGADANSWPTAVYSVGGNVAEGQPVVAIIIQGYQVPAPDEFGNTQYAYAPQKLLLGYELSGGGAPLPAVTDLFAALFESTNTGVAVYQIALPNGTAVTAANINAAAVTQELNNTWWPNKGV